MHKVEKGNLNNKLHYLLAYKAIEKNKDLFLDDSVTSIEDYLNEVHAGMQNGNLGYLYYIDSKLYAVIYVDFDRYKNATLNFSLFETNNFFKTVKVILFLIKHLFEDHNANKVKANIFPFEHLAEAVYRYTGLRKEGIAKDEIKLKGKPMSLVNLALTRNDYMKNNRMSRKEFKEIIRKLKK